MSFGDFAIVGDDLTFETSESIYNLIWTSLNVKKGSFFQNPEFGSRLSELTREKNVERVRLLSIDYSKDALQWLIDAGKATAVEVIAEKDLRDLNRINILITVTQTDGQDIEFKTFVEVI